MGIFSVVRAWLNAGQNSGLSQDALLDWCIADALSDEAQEPVPPGAWNRLRKAVADRKAVHGYGMWVLDQTTHDPPDSIPATLSEAQFARALHIQSTYRSRQRLSFGHPSLGGVSPTFFAVFTL